VASFSFCILFLVIAGAVFCSSEISMIKAFKESVIEFLKLLRASEVPYSDSIWLVNWGRCW
jgi:hypothetical protein